MPAKEFAIENSFIITITQMGAGVPAPASGHNYIKITSSKAKANNEALLLQTLSWITVGCTAPAGNCTGGGSMNATATKCKSESKFVMRKGDFGTCNGTAQIPFGTTPATCKFEITDAGQNKVKGE